MSRHLVIDARAKAIFNKFWKGIGDNPEWLKQLFRDDPPMLDLLLAAFTSSNPAGDFQKLVSAVKRFAYEDAKEQAELEVSQLQPAVLQWLEDTFEYK